MLQTIAPATPFDASRRKRSKLPKPSAASPHLSARSSELGPESYRLTIHHCEVLDSAGLLPARYELIGGMIYEKMPTKPRHSYILYLLSCWMESLFGRAYVKTQDKVKIEGKYNRPEPDITVMNKPMSAFQSLHPGSTDMHLVIEISDTTLDFDQNTKADIYSAAGIVEYWVVDVNNRVIIVHRQASPDGYLDIQSFGSDDLISTAAKPGESILVGELLPLPDQA